MNSLNIYAAGSLRYALPTLVEQFKQLQPTDITLQFSPAGLLCDKIQQEANAPIAHLFASANSDHPQQLVTLGLAKYQQRFTRNRLCMMMRKQHQPTNWLDILLNPTNRIGMSTPKKDPSGDYTFALFDGIEAQYAGQGQQLKQRAMQLVGGALSSALPTGTHPAEYFLLNNQVDVFICYASYVKGVGLHPQLMMIDIPQPFYPPINYAVALLNHPHKAAASFIDFVCSDIGQDYLVQRGFMKI